LKTETKLELRVTKRPYFAFLVVGGWVPLWLLFLIVTKPDDRVDGIFALCLGVALFVWLFLAFRYYRIGLYDGTLVQWSLLQSATRVPVASISRWRCEVGWPDQSWIWLPHLRPFRRVAIYYEDNGSERHLDVSLNHFDIEQTRMLIEAVRELRPDLGKPSDFPGERGKRRSIETGS
jgi:hypothetical protein